MLAEYIEYIFENSSGENFKEQAINKLIGIIPEIVPETAEYIVDAILDEQIETADGYYINLLLHEVTKDNKKVELTPYEEQIIEILAQNTEKWVGFDDLSRAVWGYPVEHNNIRVYINAIRRKMGAGIVECIKGKGYRLKIRRRNHELQ